jgi:Terpene cyclase DEP1
MNAKQLGLTIVLAGFAALNAYDFYIYGVLGFLQIAFTNAATTAIFVDLVIALTMVAVWMTRDAAQRRVNAIPYLLLTVCLGSIGPLAYLVGRFRDDAENSSSSILHSHHATPSGSLSTGGRG